VPAIARCDWAGIGGVVECGSLDVPEDRARPSGRALTLFFVVARATGAAAGPPVFFFTGGPGTGSTDAAAGLAASLADLRRDRDFVFLDQRGTGRSARLACDAARGLAQRLRPMFDRGAAAACRDALASTADPRFYTTSEATLDVEDVRRALGYRQLNLHGSSYGTRAAWDYAARFPSRARAVLFHGLAPPDFRMPLPYAGALETALDGLIAACAADAGCAARFPSLAADVTRAFERLGGAPAAVRVGDVGGPLVDAHLSRGELAEAVRYRLYAPGDAATLPSLLTRAAAGDYAPIANTLVAHRARLDLRTARGMFLSVTCAEDLPFIGEADIRDAARSTRLGDYRVRQQMDACREWPRGAPLGAHNQAPLEVPALVLNGEFDPATPAVTARRAMSRLPNGRLVIVPHAGHGFASLGIDACIDRLTTEFLRRGSARDLDASCVAAARRPPFTLR
jgi:pimeloyl-ACP methyl ester carboxylesterase